MLSDAPTFTMAMSSLSTSELLHNYLVAASGNYSYASFRFCYLIHYLPAESEEELPEEYRKAGRFFEVAKYGCYQFLLIVSAVDGFLAYRDINCTHSKRLPKILCIPNFYNHGKTSMALSISRNR